MLLGKGRKVHGCPNSGKPGKQKKRKYNSTDIREDTGKLGELSKLTVPPVHFSALHSWDISFYKLEKSGRAQWLALWQRKNQKWNRPLPCSKTDVSPRCGVFVPADRF